MRNTAIILVPLCIAIVMASCARAEDLRWFSGALGTGQNVDSLRVGGAWQPDCACESLTSIGATPLVLGHIEYWNARGDGKSHDSSVNVGALLGARWLLPARSPTQPFIEFAFGGIAQSHVRIGARALGSMLLFDSRLGAGIALDSASKYQLAAYVEHRSNARLREPNDGLTTYGVELRVALR
ncbi:MAG: acyloxyacyl hydrolase [Betaproteobacteria bacterium]